MPSPLTGRPGPISRSRSKPKVEPPPPKPGIEPSQVPIGKMDERFERGVVGGRDRAGKLLALDKGKPGKGLEVSVHGINGSPDSMQPMQKVAVRKGLKTATVAYDDNYRRLTKSSADLANNLSGWLRQNPGKPLQIDAHSMGARVALGAVDQLQQQGLLKGRKVELNLVAPTLQGFGGANWAKIAPAFGDQIKNVAPGRDMGTRSDFQRRIDALQLDPNISVRVFTGGADKIVDSGDPAFKRIQQRLGARSVSFGAADHVSAIEAAADWLRRAD